MPRCALSRSLLVLLLMVGIAAASSPATKAQHKLARGPRPATQPSLAAEQPLAALVKGLVQSAPRLTRGRTSATRPPVSGKATSSRLRAVSTGSWQRLLARRQQPADWTVTWGDDTGTPRTIDASTTLQGAARPASAVPHLQALDLVSKHPALFRLQTPAAELSHLQTIQDANGQAHVRFQRQIGGIPVWGEDLVFHLTPAGGFTAFNGHYSPSDVVVDDTHEVRRREAIAAARRHLVERIGEFDAPSVTAQQLLKYDGPQAQLSYLPTTSGLELVWVVEIRPTLRDRYRLFVGAADARVLEWYNATAEDGPALGRATDVLGVARDLNTYAVGEEFVLIDASRPSFAAQQPDVINDPQGAIVTLDAGGSDLNARNPVSHFESEDNTWSDPVAVSAHYHAGIIFDYFLNTHGRLGIDGLGGSLISIVHVTEEGEPMDNAYWNGVFTVFGDGDEAFEPLAAALDVTAHEMTHGVIERTVNLEYLGQSGAINESLADVFAAMVDRDDWQLAEDIAHTTVFPSGALRDMSDPANGGGGPGDFFWQPGHMDEFVTLPDSIDNGGVHINSGIPNRACFLLTEALGHDKAEQIYYRVLDARLLNIRSNFQDLRWAVRRAAVDLFGEESTEVAAVADAFDAVGIGVEGRYEAPTPRTPTPGEEWLVVVNADGVDNSLFLVRSEVASEEDILQLSPTQVFVETGNAVDVATDGSFVLFVDADNNLRVVNSDGTDETVLSDSGDWSSIALSPDGSTLAATSVFIDTTIFILDLFDPDQSREIKLRGATTQTGVQTGVVLFADAIDWDQDGELLVYDAFNQVPTATGEGFDYWNVGLLDPTSGLTLPLFPPQPEGVHLGNPAFSQTTARHLVFDVYDETTEENEIWIHDYVSGDAGLIVKTSGFGFPSFSTDDSELAFERSPDGETLNVSRVELAEDRLSAAADPEDFLFEAQTAKWLLEPGEVSTAVEQTESAVLPQALQLSPNVPNPFNPVTSISFDVERPGRVRLSVFDVRGARVVDLVDETLVRGTYRTTWTGTDEVGRAVSSGVYLYRLQWQDERGRAQQLTRRMALVR